MAVALNNKVGAKLGSASPANIDLSAYVTSFTINRNFDELDITAMGDTGHRYTAGLEASSVTIEFLNDDGASGVLQTLNTLVGTNAYFKFIQDTSAAVSAANPLYTGLVFVNNITPINGAVGDIRTQSVTFNVSGAVAVANTGTW